MNLSSKTFDKIRAGELRINPDYIIPELRNGLINIMYCRLGMSGEAFDIFAVLFTGRQWMQLKNDFAINISVERAVDLIKRSSCVETQIWQ